MPRGSLLLALACVLHVALRSLWLDRAFDHISFANYELYPPGTVGRILQLGLEQPLGIIYDNSAGYFINGALAAVAYAAFGATYLSYKLVPLAYGVATLLLVYGWVRGLLGPRRAVVAAFLFALGPTELLQKYSVAGTGNHFENLFYLTANLWSFDAAMRAGSDLRKWFLAGLLAGLSLFVFLGAVIPVGCVCALHLIVKGARPWLRDLRGWAPGFALGASPLLVINLAVAARGSGYLAAKFTAPPSKGEVAGLLERLEVFLGEDLVQAPFLSGTGPLYGLGLRWLWIALFLGLGTPVALRLLRALCCRELLGRGQESAGSLYQRTRLAPVLLWTPLAALAYALSDLRNGGHRYPVEMGGYRYFLPHFHLLPILLLAAFEPSTLRRALAARFLGPLAAVWGLALTLYGATAILPLRHVLSQGADAGFGARQEGYNFEQYARAFVMASSGMSLADACDAAEALPPEERHRFHWGLGYHRAQGQVVFRADLDGDGRVSADERREVDPMELWSRPLDLERLLDGVPEEHWIDHARGAGTGLRTLLVARGAKGNQALVSAVIEGLRRGHPMAEHVVEGVCRVQDHPTLAIDSDRHFRWHTDTAFRLHEASLVLEAEGEAQVADQLRQATGVALGRFFGTVLARAHRPDLARLAGVIPEEAERHRAPLFRGMGIGLAESRSRPVFPSEWIALHLREDLVAPVRAAFDQELLRRGMSETRQVPSPALEVVVRWLSDLTSAVLEPFLGGTEGPP